ncbi:MAG: two-component sensor histidine kinase [Roseovarius sp.]|nr:two-component sensor histidine kinase [Roseovarius sp.]
MTVLENDYGVDGAGPEDKSGKPRLPLLTAFHDLPLHRRFAIVGGIVSLIGMVLIAAFVNSRIESAVVRNSAISAAVYMESLIAPLSQELADGNALSEERRAKLEELLARPATRERILSVKIWKEGGHVAYASDGAMIGQTFKAHDDLLQAWQGDIIAGFDDLDHDESRGERAFGLPLLEVYNPIHSIRTGEIIAVAEFYQDASELHEDLRVARWTAWAVVAAVAGLTFVTLFGIVRAGSRTIEFQRSELQQRLRQITKVGLQNDLLRLRIQSASEQFSALNEQLLRRIGAELHDGPAQALAFANMRISAWRKSGGPEEADLILRALEEALADIRGLARGLVLPKLEGATILETIRRAADAHAERTQTEVILDSNAEDGDNLRPGLPQLICIFRFVQEGLMNAWRHADGVGQKVEFAMQGGSLVVSVSDRGPGFDPKANFDKGRIGLAGLRERVQSVGGIFDVDTGPGRGTRLTMRLQIEKSAP